MNKSLILPFVAGALLFAFALLIRHDMRRNAECAAKGGTIIKGSNYNIICAKIEVVK